MARAAQVLSGDPREGWAPQERTTPLNSDCECGSAAHTCCADELVDAWLGLWMVLGDDGGWPEFLQGLGLPTDVPFDMLEHDLDGDDGIGNDGAWWGVSYEVWEKAVAPEPTTLASSTS